MEHITKRSPFFCLLLVIIINLYAANNTFDIPSGCQKDELHSRIIKIFEEIYEDEMRDFERIRREDDSRTDPNPVTLLETSFGSLAHCIKFEALVDKTGRTIRGQTCPRDKTLRRKDKPNPYTTFYKKIDLPNLKETPSSAVEPAFTGKSLALCNIAKITTCVLSALKSTNTIEFSEKGPYEVSFSHNLPKHLVRCDDNYDNIVTIGYLLHHLDRHQISPNVHLILYAKLPMTLKKLKLTGVLSDYDVKNAPKGLYIEMLGRHNTLDKNKQSFNKPIYLGGCGNDIEVFSTEEVKLDQNLTAGTYRLIPE